MPGIIISVHFFDNYKLCVDEIGEKSCFIIIFNEGKE